MLQQHLVETSEIAAGGCIWQGNQPIFTKIACHEVGPGGYFTNVSQALQIILLKFVYCRNRTSCENFKLELYTCTQSHALGTRTKFQLEIPTINLISGIVFFARLFWRGRKTLVKQPPGTCHKPTYQIIVFVWYLNTVIAISTFLSWSTWRHDLNGWHYLLLNFLYMSLKEKKNVFWFKFH